MNTNTIKVSDRSEACETGKYYSREDQYVESKVMNKILMDCLSKNASELKQEVEALNIDVTEEEIKRVEGNTHYLEYFKRYTDILKTKCNVLLTLIEKITEKDTVSIEKQLKQLDVQMNDQGKILYPDVIRLLSPTMYNINHLKFMIERANNIESYMTDELVSIAILTSGEVGMYPQTVLQMKNVVYESIPGYIPLSNRQQKAFRYETQEGCPGIRAFYNSKHEANEKQKVNQKA